MMVRLTTVQIECEDNGCRSQKEKKRFHPPSAQAPNQPEPSVGHEWQAVNPEGSVSDEAEVAQECDKEVAGHEDGRQCDPYFPSHAVPCRGSCSSCRVQSASVCSNKYCAHKS